MEDHLIIECARSGKAAGVRGGRRQESGANSQGCAILVINLDRSPGRLAFQTKQASQLGLSFERVRAVDGAEISRETYRRYAFRWQRVMTRNEVACLLSHSLCWKRTAEIGRTTLILEDDAVLAADMPAFPQSVTTLEGPHVINLETQLSRSFLSRWPVQEPSFKLYPLLTAVAGAAGYIITPEAARVLLAGLPGEAGLADNYIWGRRKVRRSQADPALCMALDVLQAHYGGRNATVSRSTIAKGKTQRLQKLSSYVRHPGTAWRRIRAQSALGLSKIVLPRVAEYRVVEPHPSIIARYAALEGSRYGPTHPS